METTFILDGVTSEQFLALIQRGSLVYGRPVEDSATLWFLPEHLDDVPEPGKRLHVLPMLSRTTVAGALSAWKVDAYYMAPKCLPDDGNPNPIYQMVDVGSVVTLAILGLTQQRIEVRIAWKYPELSDSIERLIAKFQDLCPGLIRQSSADPAEPAKPEQPETMPWDVMPERWQQEAVRLWNTTHMSKREIAKQLGRNDLTSKTLENYFSTWRRQHPGLILHDKERRNRIMA